MAVVFLVMVLASRREKRWIREQLQEEVARGVLSPAEHEMVGSYRRRIGAQWRALGQAGWKRARQLSRLAQLATELVFKKHQLSTRGDEGGDLDEIIGLRERIAALRAEMGVVAARRFCTACGHSLEQGRRFCTRCGI